MEDKETKEEIAKEDLSNMILKIDGLPELIRKKGDDNSAEELETARSKARTLVITAYSAYSEEKFNKLYEESMNAMDFFAKQYKYDSEKRLETISK